MSVPPGVVSQERDPKIMKLRVYVRQQVYLLLLPRGLMERQILSEEKVLRVVLPLECKQIPLSKINV